MKRTLKIEEILRNSLAIQHLQIENQSAHHSGHYQGDGETHFALIIVSSDFNGKNRIQRQRTVNDLLKSEWALGLHALAIKAMTPDEYLVN
jgi:BolA protein